MTFHPRTTLRSPLVAASIIAVFALLTACGSDDQDKTATEVVTLVTHESFALSDDVLAQFTADTGYRIEILAAGDAGTMLNQSILTAGDPLGDVIFGVDSTFLSRALDAELTVPHQSPLLAQIPDSFQLDKSNRLLPVDVGDVCLNFDVQWFTDAAIEPPTNLADLTRATYKDLLVVQNPATSSPGLAFALATIAEFGTDGDYDWLDYWAELSDNGVKIQPGWSEAYYTDFTLYGGDRPIVVSYATSPPAEVYFADPRPESAPSAVVEASCYRQHEFVGVLAGTDNPEGARAFVDFLLSVTAQQDIPWNMFVFPVNELAEVPAEFSEHSLVPSNPLSVPSQDIEANRESWIQQWSETAIG
ncbi:MAG: thiamine ABC transporter substrate-binding protein [Actinomycetia bacterium]|nr:thiamine ABC transporter substrate-binding protein [Actinomycetes bacterium]MCP4960973.1 thiamine ABC transporter substrate-binding protein [Actinomycetes bacterium]